MQGIHRRILGLRLPIYRLSQLAHSLLLLDVDDVTFPLPLLLSQAFTSFTADPVPSPSRIGWSIFRMAQFLRVWGWCDHFLAIEPESIPSERYSLSVQAIFVLSLQACKRRTRINSLTWTCFRPVLLRLPRLLDLSVRFRTLTTLSVFDTVEFNSESGIASRWP
ncbi:hypothetical protein PENSPDRAFT_432062 [Peniophora sp. CONT]|nr:hypothetical protein PENSPDRAFT_432062 [Peniophora sp. CONT]